jgi:cell division protein FtsI (penicillin-binding protein 3)
VIDTSPGYIKVGAKLLEDPHNLGAINLATILAKSSNVGMTKVALALEPAQMYGTLTALGFGQVTTSGIRRVRRAAASLLALAPGRHLVDVARLRPVDHAAAARARIRDRGVVRHRAADLVPARRDAAAASARARRGVARTLIHLLESVVAPDGGGKHAAIPGYTVAGKTGTAWKATAGGYATDRYLAVFGGVAPASNRRASRPW